MKALLSTCILVFTILGSCSIWEGSEEKVLVCSLPPIPNWIQEMENNFLGELFWEIQGPGLVPQKVLAQNMEQQVSIPFTRELMETPWVLCRLFDSKNQLRSIWGGFYMYNDPSCTLTRVGGRASSIAMKLLHQGNVSEVQNFNWSKLMEGMESKLQGDIRWFDEIHVLTKILSGEFTTNDIKTRTIFEFEVLNELGTNQGSLTDIFEPLSTGISKLPLGTHEFYNIDTKEIWQVGVNSKGDCTLITYPLH